MYTPLYNVVPGAGIANVAAVMEPGKGDPVFLSDEDRLQLSSEASMAADVLEQHVRDAIRATYGASPHRASRPRSLERLAKSRRLRPARVLAAASPWPR